MSVTRASINKMLKASKLNKCEVCGYESIKAAISVIASKPMPPSSTFFHYGRYSHGGVYHMIMFAMSHSNYRREKIEEFYKSIHG